MKVTAKNVMKQKSFHKGIYQLVQEGAIQLYKTYLTEEYIIGAVGQLQFEVFQYRMLFIPSVRNQRNHIPRQSLNYRTPLELFLSYVQEAFYSSLI